MRTAVDLLGPPLVSVIVPAYNAAGTLARAVRSIRTRLPAEVILVDDGSRDQTWPCIKALEAADPRVTAVRLNENAGPAAARNRALRIARGRWIAVLDADDEYLPWRLDDLVEAGERLQADFLFDNLRVREGGETGSERRWVFSRRPRQITPEWLFSRDLAYQRQPIGYCKPVVRRSFLEVRWLSYREAFRTGEDFLLLSEMLLSGGRGFVVPSASYVYRKDLGDQAQGAFAETARKPREVWNTQALQMDVLTLRYGERLNARGMGTFRLRRRWIDARLAWLDFREHLRRGRLATAARTLLRDPLILPLALLFAAWALTALVDPPPRAARRAPPELSVAESAPRPVEAP